MFKKSLRKFIPPIVLEARAAFLSKKPKKLDIGRNAVTWNGNYESWESARSMTSGYDAEIIFKRTAESILKVKSGEAAYERDSVIFDKPQFSWPLVAILLKIAMENGNKLSVLDFGGSLGSSYFQNRNFFDALPNFLWSVVEQEHYIDYGNENIADSHLKFYFNIDECIAERNPSVLLLSGVIQCIDSPYSWIKKFTDKSFDYIIFDRTAFIEDGVDRLTIQTVPESIYPASYPAWFFDEDNILSAMTENFEFIMDFDNGITPEITLDGKRAYWKGLYFKRKNG